MNEGLFILFVLLLVVMCMQQRQTAGAILTPDNRHNLRRVSISDIIRREDRIHLEVVLGGSNEYTSEETVSDGGEGGLEMVSYNEEEYEDEAEPTASNNESVENKSEPQEPKNDDKGKTSEGDEPQSESTDTGQIINNGVTVEQPTTVTAQQIGQPATTNGQEEGPLAENKHSPSSSNNADQTGGQATGNDVKGTNTGNQENPTTNNEKANGVDAGVQIQATTKDNASSLGNDGVTTEVSVTDEEGSSTTNSENDGENVSLEIAK